MKTCTFEGCERKRRAKGLCSGHYQQLTSGRELVALRPKTKAPAEAGSMCLFDLCDRPTRALGLCTGHYAQQRREATRSPIVRLGERTEPGMKTCSACARTLPVVEFTRDARNVDGLRYRCRVCHNAANSARKTRAYEAHWAAQGIPLECYVCRGPYEDVEHVIPQSHPNGHDVPENTLPSCAEHNRGQHGKHDRDLTAWLLSRRDLPSRGEVLARVVKYGVWPSGDMTPEEFCAESADTGDLWEEVRV